MKPRLSVGSLVWFVLWCGYTLGLLALYVRFPGSPDDAVYDYIGWIAKEGGTVYVDAADQNWPGMVYLHVFSTFLFGNKLSAYHSFDCFMLLAGCAVLAMFAKKYVGLRAALLVVPIYQAIYLSQSHWMTGQRDIVATPLLLLAAFAQLKRLEGKSIAWSPFQGVMLGLATFIRPTLLLMAGLLALEDLWIRASKNRRDALITVRDQVLVLLGIVFVLGSCALLGWKSGALQGWWSIAMLYNFQVYGAHGRTRPELLLSLYDNLKFWVWAIAIGGVGFVVGWKKQPRAAAILLLVALTGVLSMLVQKKGFGYHLGPLYPVMALFMAPAIDWAIDKLAAARAAGAGTQSRPETRPRLEMIAAVGICALTVLGLAKKVYGNLKPEIKSYLGEITPRDILASDEPGLPGFSLADAVDLAAYVKATTPPAGHFLLWGRPMHVNFIAERRSPSRFASFALFDETRDTFVDFPLWEAEFRKDLDEKPPQLICLGRSPGGVGYEHLPESSSEHRLSDVLLSVLKARYERDRSFGSVECLRRKTDAQHPG